MGRKKKPRKWGVKKKTELRHTCTRMGRKKNPEKWGVKKTPKNQILEGEGRFQGWGIKKKTGNGA